MPLGKSATCSSATTDVQSGRGNPPLSNLELDGWSEGKALISTFYCIPKAYGKTSYQDHFDNYKDNQQLSLSCLLRLQKTTYSTGGVSRTGVIVLNSRHSISQRVV
ncbi:MAG TPA: hypothetical protein VLV84_05545 [Candidatus Acidoferrales bacterium]|nr:hypothetical protein [Candidatus Acidoferrales bacterium]